VTTFRAVRAALGALLLLLVTACADTGGGAGATDPARSSADSYAPDDVVLRVSHTGGFLNPAMLAGRLPIISVYGDGRVIAQGPQVLSYPPPALPNILVRRVGQDGVRALVERARAAGIDGSPVDYGQPNVADAPATKFTVGDDTVEVSALTEAPDTGAGLTEAQAKARDKLRDLLAALTDLPATLGAATVGEEQPYRSKAVAAIASAGSPSPTDPDLAARPKELDWPGPALPGASIAPETGCVTATGAQAAAVLAAAAEASAATPWRSGGRTWTVALRPLLPDETDCADLTRG
jgi:hypothetical protein